MPKKKARRARSAKRRSNASADGNRGVELIAPPDIVRLPPIERRAVSDDWRILDFTMQPQSEANWCWAAVGVGVVHFYDHASDLNQCTLASDQLGHDCCSSPDARDACDEPYRPLAKMLKRLDHLQLPPNRGHVRGALSFDEVREEIDKGRPVVAHLNFSELWGHFVVIAGCNLRTHQVLIRDPAFDDGPLDYDTFRNHYLATPHDDGGQWTISYRTVRHAD